MAILYLWTIFYAMKIKFSTRNEGENENRWRETNKNDHDVSTIYIDNPSISYPFHLLENIYSFTVNEMAFGMRRCGEHQRMERIYVNGQRR